MAKDEGRNVVIAMDESDFANFAFECKYSGSLASVGSFSAK